MRELVSVFRSYKLKSNYQEKQIKTMMETKKRYIICTVKLIILPNSNCTKNLKLTVKEKGHKQENKKISNEIKKDVGIKKSATGPQCKPTRSKHGMVTRLTC